MNQIAAMGEQTLKNYYPIVDELLLSPVPNRLIKNLDKNSLACVLREAISQMKLMKSFLYPPKEKVVEISSNNELIKTTTSETHDEEEVLKPVETAINELA